MCNLSFVLTILQTQKYVNIYLNLFFLNQVIQN